MYIVYAFQLIIAVGLINVWLLRFHKSTKYRGQNAQNMQEEFAAYGLPTWFMYMVGAGKILIAALMIIGLWVPVVVRPASALLVLLMIGAVSMHIKVKDPLQKSLPALGMLTLSTIVLVLS